MSSKKKKRKTKTCKTIYRQFMSEQPPRYRLGDKHDLIDTSSSPESVTPFTPRRRNQQALSARVAELNEELLLGSDSR